ncbi:hypothetical protein KFU94_26360 [Chloroflexi bacterium TSY]|nr:hypothetical protein [Chloroflexi bacterium TSY]
MQQKTETTVSISLKNWQWFLMGVLVALVLFGGVSACYQGRKISRWTGRPVRINLPAEVTSYQQVVSISFHKNSNGETIKDVTYMGRDEKLHSQEFNDWGILQGEIIWEIQGRD